MRFANGIRAGSSHVRVELYGVVSRASGEVLDVFNARAQADELVATWDADEPDEAGALHVVELVIERSLN